MQKITSPLHALEQIRTLSEPGAQPVYEILRRTVNEVAAAGIAAASLPAPTRKAARDLVPGDVLVFADTGRVVVTYAAPAPKGEAVIVAYVPLGILDMGVRTVGHAPDSQFTVEPAAGLTPVQVAADKLFVWAVRLLDMETGRRVKLATHELTELHALVNDLEPPTPPTLDEALDVLRLFATTDYDHTAAFAAAEKLLARVPT